jgi:hypothetical protein
MCPTIAESANKLSCTPSSGGGGGGGFHSLNGPEYLFNTSQEVVENIFKAELEYEREKRKELERRLDAKDNQVGEAQKRKELERSRMQKFIS